MLTETAGVAVAAVSVGAGRLPVRHAVVAPDVTRGLTVVGVTIDPGSYRKKKTPDVRAIFFIGRFAGS